MLADTFEVIESALLTQYGVPREDAARLEQELFQWFDRLSRRPGSPDSVRALRPQLIAMSCRVGHIYWAGKLDSEQPGDERVKRTLALGPDVIAFEIERRIDAQPDRKR